MDEDTNNNEEKNPTELDVVTQQRDEYLASWQRTKADLINYKKDEGKRLDEISKYANQGLIKDLIGVMDNFDLALRSLEKAGPAHPSFVGQNSGGSIEKGIYLIRSQVEDILRKRGLEKISVKRGDEFDPNIAEAMTEIPSDQPHGTIVEEIEPGYRLHDKIVRAARVIVSKGPSSAERGLEDKQEKNDEGAKHKGDDL